MAEIDWAEQWDLHAFDFREGKAHIPLTSELSIQLEPGPGFGDFSHPTTRLMIQMMKPYIADSQVFDVGCGSGILSVSAAALGASSVAVCDIDPNAVVHAMRNAALNRVQLRVTKPQASSLVVLMNMIASEQKIAWEQHQVDFSILITSGVLSSGRDEYLSFAHSAGWQIQQEFELEGWLGFIFISQ